MSLLSLSDLSLSIKGTPILKNINLTLEKGQCLGIVGESGSGKSLTALSIMQLLPRASSLSGSIALEGTEITALPESDLCQWRGDKMAMIFQEPMTALNPLQPIGKQITESILLHTSKSRHEADLHMRHLLGRVGLDPDLYSPSRYPHQLSGGQRQRVIIAMAIAMRPSLLIADEPTTALDVTTQAQILDLLKELVEEDQTALMLISHDLAVVAQMSDQIAIMKQGQIVEQGSSPELFESLKHPYSLSLLEASTHQPKRSKPPLFSDCPKLKDKQPILKASNLKRTYPLPRKFPRFQKREFEAVKQVDLTLHPGQSIGLVGESGCGKSTLAKTLLGLDKPQAGALSIDGINPFASSSKEQEKVHRAVQIVFQDPNGSFNPRHKVGRSVAEPLHLYHGTISKAERDQKIKEVFAKVGINPDHAERYPHEFSGGQRQRLAIARALITHPKIIIADEPVSALDVSIRAQILDLMTELRETLDLAYLFITHDLSVVRVITDELLIMKQGEIVEHGKTEAIFQAPSHSYTKQLLASAPNLQQAISDKKRQRSI